MKFSYWLANRVSVQSRRTTFFASICAWLNFQLLFWFSIFYAWIALISTNSLEIAKIFRFSSVNRFFFALGFAWSWHEPKIHINPQLPHFSMMMTEPKRPVPAMAAALGAPLRVQSFSVFFWNCDVWTPIWMTSRFGDSTFCWMSSTSQSMMKGSVVLLKISKKSNRQSMDGVLYCSESSSKTCLISSFIVKLCQEW